jgi:hypothetical protein
MRHAMPSTRLLLLPSGTASNESLHREINTWFRQTQKLHTATLELKLSILHLAKLLAHNSALYRHTTKQVGQAAILARVTRKSPWTARQWERWCQSLFENRQKPLNKAVLQLYPQRQQQVAAVRAMTPSKKPAAAGLKRKRTPHTLERVDGLRRAGKKVKCD